MHQPDSIPVVLCIDVEPDARHLDPVAPSPWDGVAGTRAVLERFRARVAQRTGVPARFAWFIRMDHQVEKVYGSASWVAEAHRTALQDWLARSDHVGLHVHACRWVGGVHGWLVDYGNQPWIDECLEAAFAAFERALGFRSAIFRFGDHWMNQATFEKVAALGVEVDLTLEPGYDSTDFYAGSEPMSGVLPDYRGVPERPYLPSASDYRADEGPSRVATWELPVTTARAPLSPLHRLYRRYIRRIARSEIAPAIVSHRPAVFSAIVDEALRRPQPHLVLTLRTGAATSPMYTARIEKNLSALLERPDAARFTWVTPAEALALLAPPFSTAKTRHAGA